MPRFELEPVDGGESIDLPYGETVIGRGPFLGVNDKRVSRNHGILENVDGQLRIKPTHLNPCFIQASLEAAPEPLEKDQWHCLKEGSIISLLPGKYVYSVHVVTEENTPRNSQGFEDETQMETKEKSKPSGVSQETLEYNPLARSSASLTSESTLTTQVEEKEEEPCKPDPTSCSQVAVSASKADLSASQTPRRTRVLPAWMTASAPTAPSTSTGKAAAKRAPAQTASKTAQSKQTTGPKRARTKQPVSEAEEEEENEEEEEHSKVEKKPRKRARKLNSDTEESQDQATAPKPQGEPSLEDRLSEDSEREEEEEKRRGRKRAEATPGSRARGSEAQNSKKEKMPSRNGQQSSKGSKLEINTASKPNVQRRTPCPYGTSCYRKNPVHFQECSHPGDDDYETEQRKDQEEDEPDDRPECPYGTDCYRKNPQHKKEYKHTKPPAKSVPDDDDEDEDHYEDSFINDESEEEEVDEDSDYVPESDDSGKEDIKRLQKEAKAFLKKKK